MRNQYSSTEFWNKNEKRIRSDILVNPFLIDAVGEVRNKKLLDIGCGNGYLTEYFAKKGADVVGIDRTQELIKLSSGRKGSYSVGNATKIKFPSNTFDKAYSSMVFLHLNDSQLKKAFKEAHRVLKYDGEFTIGDPHPTTLIQSKESGFIKHNNKNIDYFKTQKVSAIVYDLGGKSFKIDYYHRSFSTYLNIAFDAGFSLKRLIEPKPTKKHVLEFGNLLKSEETQPGYIILVFRKE